MTTKTAEQWHQEGADLLYINLRTSQGFECIKKALELKPDFAEAVLDLGFCYQRERKYQDALNEVEKAMKLKQPSAKAYYLQALCLFNLSNTSLAEDAFKKAEDMNEKSQHITYLKYIIYNSRGKRKEAIAVLDEAIKLYSSFTGQEAARYKYALTLAWIDRGNEHYYQADYNGAIVNYKEATKVDPTDSIPVANIALCYTQLGKNEEAVGIYDTAIEFEPDNPKNYTSKGQLLQKFGREREALNCFNTAFELTQQGKWGRLRPDEKDFINSVMSGARQELLKKLDKLEQISKETEKAVENLEANTEMNKEVKAKFQKLFTKVKEDQKVLTDKIVSNMIKPKDEKKEATVNQGLDSELAELKKQFLEMQNQMSQQITELKQVQAAQEQELEKHKSILKDSGALARAELARGFKDLEENSPELHKYCKTLYWTTVNMFGAYRNLSTGLIQGNVDHDESLREKLFVNGAKKVAQIGAEIAKGIPFVGGVIGALDTIIDCLYSTVKENRFQNKMNAVNKIIQGKLGLEDEISLNIGKVALAVANGKADTILAPAPKAQKTKGMEWLQSKIDDISSSILPTVELHDKNNYATKLALEDAALLIAYICKHHEDILKRKETLDIQCVTIIQYGGLDGMYENVGHEETARNAQSSGCCSLFC